jgi:hypothetical protein
VIRARMGGPGERSGVGIRVGLILGGIVIPTVAAFFQHVFYYEEALIMMWMSLTTKFSEIMGRKLRVFNTHTGKFSTNFGSKISGSS